MISQLTRRAILLASAAISLAPGGAWGLVRRGGGNTVSGSDVLLTTRVVTNTSGSTPIATSAPLRFGVAFKRGDVPSGSVLKLKDGAGNVLTYQADARATWADGSLKFAEIICVTTRAIAASGAETISISRQGLAAAWNNTLPGGKTAAQLLTDVQSFVGAQDLNISLSQPISASAASNVYTAAGPWIADFNTDAALGGVNVQQTNMGPCCMGFRVWGRFNDGTRDHIHLYPTWYVWIWLNPSTGAIRDVEWIAAVHNALLDHGVDGTSYASFPPDRYSYVATLKNQTNTIATTGPLGQARQQATISTIGAASTTLTVQTTAPHSFQVGDWIGFPAAGFVLAGVICQVATVPDTTHLTATAPSAANATTIATSATFISGVGGHHARARWFTARTDGKPRWAAASSIEPTALITLDAAGRAYVYAGGLVPKWDETIAWAASPVTCTYAPFKKGFWGDSESVDSDYTVNAGIDSGGASIWLGSWPSWCARGFIVQTANGFQNNRINAMHIMGHPTNYTDVNGRPIALDGLAYTGLNTSNTIFCNSEAASGSHAGVTPRTEITRLGAGYWSGVNGDIMDWASTHQPNPSNVAYLQEGYRHLLDTAIDRAQANVLWKSPTLAGSFNLCRQRSGAAGIPPSPGLAGTYNGVIIGSTGAPREDAHAFNLVCVAAALCPDALADGTACGEKAWFKQVVSQSVGWAADYVTNVASANMKAIGGWDFHAQTPSQPNNGAVQIDEWMLAYLSDEAAQGYKMLGDEAFGADFSTWLSLLQKSWELMYDGHVTLYLLGNQEMGVVRYGLAQDFVPNGSFIGGSIEVPAGVTEPASQVLFDAATGNLTTVSAGTSTPLAVPFVWTVGDQIILTRNSSYDGIPPGAGHAWPLEIPDLLGNAGSATNGMNSQILFIASVDSANNRFKVALTNGGAAITSWSASSIQVNYFCIKLQNGPGSLSAGISAGAVTLPVNNSARFSASGVVLIDQELITYTGNSGGNLTGCTRATGGTSAALHLINATVLQGWLGATGNSAQLWNVQRAIRSMRGAGFTSSAMTIADNNVTVALATLPTNAALGSPNFPNYHILV